MHVPLFFLGRVEVKIVFVRVESRMGVERAWLFPKGQGR